LKTAISYQAVSAFCSTHDIEEDFLFNLKYSVNLYAYKNGFVHIEHKLEHIFLPARGNYFSPPSLLEPNCILLLKSMAILCRMPCDQPHES
jgi:hypothetical protein